MNILAVSAGLSATLLIVALWGAPPEKAVKRAWSAGRYSIFKRCTFPSSSGVTGSVHPGKTSNSAPATSSEPIRPLLFTRILISLVSGFGIGMVGGWGLNNWIIGVMFGVAGCFVPQEVSRWRSHALKDRLERQVENAVQLVANVQVSTGSLYLALERTASSIGDPLKKLLLEGLNQYHSGVHLPEALHSVANRSRNRDLRVLAQLVEVYETSGGRVSELLLQIARSIQTRRRIRDELSVESTSQKGAALILAAITPLSAFALWMIKPEMIRLFTDHPFGRSGAVLIAGLWLAALGLMRILLVVEEVF